MTRQQFFMRIIMVMTHQHFFSENAFQNSFPIIYMFNFHINGSITCFIWYEYEQPHIYHAHKQTHDLLLQTKKVPTCTTNSFLH